MEGKRDDKILERDMELQDQRLKSQAKHDINIADLDMQIRKIREEAEPWQANSSTKIFCTAVEAVFI